MSALLFFPLAPVVLALSQDPETSWFSTSQVLIGLILTTVDLSNWVQLLQEKWFLATLTHPQTVFSFDCLKTFQELMLQGKTSLYNYYHTLL